MVRPWRKGRNNTMQAELSKAQQYFLANVIHHLGADNNAFRDSDHEDFDISDRIEKSLIYELLCSEEQKKMIRVLGRLYIHAILCVYESECIDFLRFKIE